jgi:hypothetical protein
LRWTLGCARHPDFLKTGLFPLNYQPVTTIGLSELPCGDSPLTPKSYSFQPFTALSFLQQQLLIKFSSTRSSPNPGGPNPGGTEAVIDFLLGFTFVALILTPLVVAYTRHPAPVPVIRKNPSKY